MCLLRKYHQIIHIQTIVKVKDQVRHDRPGGVLPGDVRAADGGAERDLLPPRHRALAGPGPPHHTHHGQQEEGQGQAEGMDHPSKNI